MVAGVQEVARLTEIGPEGMIGRERLVRHNIEGWQQSSDVVKC
jgi:hypothetical protein